MAALVGRAGHSLCFLLLPGQTHHSRGGAPLSNKAPFDVLLAGKAFDNDWLLTALDARGTIAVIPPRASRKYQRAYHKEAYKGRHLMEDFFARIKE